MSFLERFSKYHKIICKAYNESRGRHIKINFHMPSLLIIIIIGGIFLALLSLIDKALAVGVIFIVFLASVTLFFINKIKEKETIKFLSALFLIVFLIHIVMVIFVYYTNFQPFSNGRGDYKEYDFVAKEISKRVPTGNFSLEGLPLVHYYPVIISYIYILTIPSILIGQLLNAWIVALVAVFVFLLVRQISRSEKEGFIVGLMVGFYPSLAFYGSLLLKDALVSLLSIIGLLLTLKIIKKFSWLNFSIFYIALIGVTHLRFYIGYALILSFIICWFIFSDLRIKKRVIYGIIIIILFGFLPRIAPLDGAVQGYMGVGSFRYYLNNRTITGYRELAYPSQSQMSEETTKTPTSPNSQLEETTKTPTSPNSQLIGRYSPIAQDSSITIDTGFEDPISFLKNISLSFTYALLGPLPWQLIKSKHLFVLPEIIPWYFLLFFIVKGVIKSIRKDYKIILPLIIFSFIVFGVLSFYMNNFGIITRIRMPAFLALLCLFPLGYEKLKNIKIPFLEKYLSR